MSDNSDETPQASACTEQDSMKCPLSVWFEPGEHDDLVFPEMDIFAAASIGSVDKVRELVARDGSCAVKKNKGNWNAIMYASHSDRPDIIDILAKAAPSCINHVDNHGRTPLMLSAMWGHDNSVKLLLKFRALLEARDHDDYTALFHAVNMGHVETVRTLLNHGANPAPIEQVGRNTPLMVAATAGQEQMCLLLMSHMPPGLIRMTNAVGDDAQSLACLNQNIDLAAMIQHYGSGAIRSHFMFSNVPQTGSFGSSSTDSSVFFDEDANVPHMHHMDGFASTLVGPKTVNKAIRSAQSCGGVFFPDEEVLDFHGENHCDSSPWLDLACFLDKLNLGQYLPVFQAQEVDLGVFLTMSDQDFREVGIHKLGPRKKMLSAIARWHSCSFHELVRAHGITPLELAYADKVQAENEQLRADTAKIKTELTKAREQVAAIREKANLVWFELEPSMEQLPQRSVNILRDMKRFCDSVAEMNRA